MAEYTTLCVREEVAEEFRERRDNRDEENTDTLRALLQEDHE